MAGLITMSVGLLASAGTYAGLSARATGAESVSSGTLNLTLSPDVGVGFSNFTGKMAPGDTDNVYVNLNNTGTLASAAGMTLGVTGLPSTALTNGSVVGEGLNVTATQCSVAWTLATGVCSGTTTPILATTVVSAMGAGVALSNIPALVAALGLLPAALSTGIGSDTQKPFAIVIVAGLISRLLLGFFVNPVLYEMVAKEGDVLQV